MWADVWPELLEVEADLSLGLALALPPELLALCFELARDSLLLPPSPAYESSSLADGGAAILTRRPFSPPTTLLKPDSQASSSELSVGVCVTATGDKFSASGSTSSSVLEC